MSSLPNFAPPHFDSFEAPRPELESLKSQFAALQEKIGQASADECQALIGEWESLRRSIESWQALASLRFHQDTTNEEYKKEREISDEMAPHITELNINLKRSFLDSTHRAALTEHYGQHAFDLWECDITTFEPVIRDDLVEQSKLVAQYVELLAKRDVAFRDDTLNLSGILKYVTDADRNTRHEAEQARWDFFSRHSEELDSLYSDLVQLRHKMAKKLGYKNFIELGYKLMQRVDYNQEDVEIFRQEIRDVVVPLALQIRELQKETLQVDELMFWDEDVHSIEGNPAPKGDALWLIEQGKTMFERMHSELHQFFVTMADGGYLDLENRSTKAGGGFCTSFPTVGMPFIFTNSNETAHDVEVLVHEAGHAFQNRNSQTKSLSDYVWPTFESAEIHSMSLEFLTWPHMELFFGDDAEKFRRYHLIKSLLFLPYGVAVDHFQHMIYDKPEATPQERHDMWLTIQKMYLPWRNHGDIPHLQKGGRWQLQRHIYGMPFYYIDYTLAQTCAFQFWVKSRENMTEALESYIQLCKRGGEAPFQTLATSAGLESPFKKGCLKEVVNHIKAYLELN